MYSYNNPSRQHHIMCFGGSKDDVLEADKCTDAPQVPSIS